MRAGVGWLEVGCVRKRSEPSAPHSRLPWQAQPKSQLALHSWRLDSTTSKRDTTYTRQIPTRYVRPPRRGATVYDCDTRVRRPHLPRRPDFSPRANFDHWLISHFAFTDGRPQVPRGAAEEEAERCHALFASRSLLGGTTHRHLKKSDIRGFGRLCLGVLVEHLLRVLSYSSAS